MAVIAKWKQRRLKAQSELEAAATAARHKAFWEAVRQPKPRLIQEHSYSESTSPIDWERLPV